jgi:hypothetical protein
VQNEKPTYGEYLKEYAFRIGSLVINLQGLEFYLRAFLQARLDAELLGLAPGEHIYSPVVGSVVNLSPLTNWDTLGELIGKCNATAEAENRPKLDPALVDIRDALAHGRIAALTPGKPTRLIKYSKPLKPHKTTVQVTFNSLLDEDWFKEQKGRVIVALETIHGEPLP